MEENSGGGAYVDTDANNNIYTDICIDPDNAMIEQLETLKLSGGIIGHVTVFTDPNDGIKKVRKTYPKSQMIEFEVMSLEQIRSYGFNVPIIYYSSPENKEFVMEYIEKEEFPNRLILTEELNKLHAITSDNFGNDFNSFVSTFEMPNNKGNIWGEWFTKNRWIAMADLTNDENTSIFLLNEADRKLMMRVSKFIPKIFENELIIPTLLHGDPHPGNMLVQKDTGKIYFIDSQCYFGDPNYENLYKRMLSDFSMFTQTNNPVLLIYFAYFCVLSHLTHTFKNSFIWRARVCMHKILDIYEPLYSNITVHNNRLNYQCAIIICGKCILFDYEKILGKSIDYCKARHSCDKSNIVTAIYPANDWTEIRKQKTGQYIFERIEINKFMLSALERKNDHCDCCIDDSIFWSGTDLVTKYKTIFPFVQKVYILCDEYNLIKYEKCFDKDQEFIVLKGKNNSEYKFNNRIKFIRKFENV